MALLNQEDRTLAYTVIRNSLIKGPNPTAVLSAALGPEGDDLVGSIAAGVPLNTVAAQVLRLLEDDGFNHIPPLLHALLEQMGGTEQQVVELLARIAEPPPAEADEFDERLLWSRRAFLGRVQLRQAFRTLAGNGGNPAIVVVNGPRFSGKSFSAELVEHLSARRSDFLPIRIELVEGTGATMGPRELAREIAMRIPVLDQPPEGTASDARWVLELVLWVLGLRMRLSPPKFWLVVDGYDHPDVPELTHVFLQNLAVEITKGTARGQVRLILLHYQRPLPVSVQGLVIPEKVNPDAIGEIDLRDYFTSVLAMYHRDYESNVVDAAVQEVLAGVVSTDHRLPKLQELVTEVTDALLAG